ncbi:helix-turn-helix domain-containing protein [Acidobacteriota bacterium]
MSVRRRCNEWRNKMRENRDVITVIDEPTYVVDMEKLLAHYAKMLLGKEKIRFKCDYQNCKRVLMSDKTRPFKCGSCGHGTMQPIKPKVYCRKCGEPIYSNVESSWKPTCFKCTARRVEEVRKLEKEFGHKIRERRRKSRKGKKVKKEDEPLGIIRNAKDYQYALELQEKKKEDDQAKWSPEELVEARKKGGLSQKTLAEYLECSASYLNMMEKGGKPLNTKALDFIREGIKFKKREKCALKEG